MKDFQEEEILSVGIDIGTSTTQLVFSRITIENLASSFNIARIEIVDKTVIYRSKIYFTPLIGENRIDMEAVKEIVDGEFRAAGISRDEVNIGAVIITGETARRDNASEVLQALSGYAGDFVVATAGPDLESILSGKGAGTDVLSKEHSLCVANIDIGGGTSNIAVFSRGDVLCAGCMDIGGRLVKLDGAGKVTYISRKIADIIREEGLDIQLGGRADEGELRKLARIMTRALAALVGLAEKDQYYDRLITQKDLPPHAPVERISFSGGVADIFYGRQDERDLFKYGDMGILLAQEMRRSGYFGEDRVVQPQETIRATVVGAGAHTTDISGSTITYVGELLPMKNIPVVKVPFDPAEPPERFAAEIRQRMEWFRLDGEFQNVAVAFDGVNSPSFRQVEDCAGAIISALDGIVGVEHPLIILVEQDMAKALGYTIRRMFQNKQPVIAIDSIHVSNGDYIDIGRPLAGGMVLPVVIKTLIFK